MIRLPQVERHHADENRVEAQMRDHEEPAQDKEEIDPGPADVPDASQNPTKRTFGVREIRKHVAVRVVHDDQQGGNPPQYVQS